MDCTRWTGIVRSDFTECLVGIDSCGGGGGGGGGGVSCEVSALKCLIGFVFLCGVTIV